MKRTSFGIKCVFATAIITISTFYANSQITINNYTTSTDAQVANALIDTLLGSGVAYSGQSFSGVRLSGTGYQIGYFTTSTTTQTQMAFTKGIVLTTGNTSDIPLTMGTDPGSVAQMSKAYTSCTAGEVRQGGTCATTNNDLDVLAGSVSFYNAAILEFDFVPASDSIRFRYVFGSEEYSDNSGSINYQCSSYNDKFGFLISGPGVAGGAGYTNNARNIARLSNGSEVGINSVNNGIVGSSGGGPSAANCIACNPAWVQNTPTPEYNGHIDGTELNGNTDVLVAAQGGLTPGATYHIKLMILDANDAAYDAVVYLEAGSFISPQPSSSINATPSTICNGGNTYVVANVSNGTAPYNYNWSTGAVHNSSNPSDSVQVSPSTNTTYSVTVTDSSLPTPLSQVLSINISVSNPVLSSSGQTNVFCYGLSTGVASVSVSGGTGPYTYSWSHNAGLNNSSASGLAAGTYTVTVSDNLTCPDTYTFTITQPAQLLTASFVPASVTNVDCYGNSTGSVTVTPSGGTAGYSYLWSHNGTLNNATATGLSAGNYSVTVTDANLCTTVASVTVTQPASALASSFLPASVTNVTCYGNSTGSATVTVTGGTTNYNYQWSHNVSLNYPSASDLASGTYTITVTDANLCTSTSNVTITQPSAALSATILPASVTSVSCFGDNTGAATVSVSGGTASYSYTWSHNAGLNSASASSMVAGTYSVTVTDAELCTALAIVTITQPAAAVGVTPSSVNSSCGNADGSVSLSVTGGTSPYSFNWEYYPDSLSMSLNNLVAGAYNVTVTDDNGCSAISSANVNDMGGPVLTLQSSDHVLCHGMNTGSVGVSITGGTAPLNIIWSNGETSNVNSGLEAGYYTLTVSDLNNCNATFSYEITEPDTLVAGLTPVNVTCHGLNDGAVYLNPIGGVASYSFNWSSGSASEDITGIGSGWYFVTVTDQNLCFYTDSILINEPDTLLASSISSDVTCYGSSDGSIDLNVSGGSGTMDFVWSSGDITEDVAALDGGEYFYTITDDNGCQYSDSVYVLEPLVLSSSILSQNVSCNGSADGSADLSVSGGNGSYTYIWTGGSVLQDLSGISGGTYYVTVTDINGCFKVDSVIITEALQLSVSASVVNVTCNGLSDGSADLTVGGGNGSNTYLWSNSSVTEDLNGLAAGVYSATVSDTNGCSAVQQVTVTEPDSISVSTVQTNITCFGQNNGSLVLTVSGGTGSLEFGWLHNSQLTLNHAEDLYPGTYTVIVTDDNNCSKTLTYSISEPPAMMIDLSVSEVLCFGASTGGIVSLVNGGSAPYAYNWSNGATTTSVQSLSAGEYSLTVTDLNGCNDSISYTITQPARIIVTEAITGASCPGSDDGSILLAVSGGAMPYVYDWSNGQNDSLNSDLTEGTYTLTITDGNGCSEEMSYSVTSLSEGCLKIPTVFSPNGDGVNDTWMIENISIYDEITIEIFNRWGDRMFVYSGTGLGYADMSRQWDGTYNGNDVPLGSFVFILNIIDIKEVIHGVVTVVK